MRPARRWSAAIAALAGLGLLAFASREGSLPLLLAALPGSLMLAGGMRALLAPDLRAPQHAASGAMLGAVLALPMALVAGAGPGLWMLALCAGAFLAAGWLTIRLEPPLEDVPAPAPSIGYSARVALDDAILYPMTLVGPPATEAALREAASESRSAQALLRERGWLEDPRGFHPAPPPIEKSESGALRIRGLEVEHLRFESEFEPEPGLPGRDRWLSYEQNRTCHAWLLRRREPAPWLVCVHGFGMGNPRHDLPAFRAKRLHRRAGLNLAFLALPVHGPRAPGRFSGEKFMGFSPVDFVHAESQAVWDLRRLIGWIRSQDATQVGVLGISLGAYTSALLSGLEEGLACVIAGLPPADLIATGERLAGDLEQQVFRAAGLDFDRDRAVHRVVSPLALRPRLERERRFIFAATGDRFVPVEQVRSLWLHWERPRISWCTGGHLSALMQHAPRAFVDEAIAAAFTTSP